MNSEERAHWLEPSPPLAVDGNARRRAPRRATIRHEASVRDIRRRFGDPEISIAECICGWVGDPCPGHGAESTALRAGLAHVASQRAPRTPRGRPTLTP